MPVTDLADPVESALALAARGWPVFPCQLERADGTVVRREDVRPEDHPLKKVPVGDLVERGFKEATTHPRRIALWWKVRPDAEIGVAMPKDTVALDVDDRAAFDAAGLEIGHEIDAQQTISGGYHVFWKTDGRRVRQTVKEIPGADTRVGGRGYVIAWDPTAFPDVSDLMPAPEWLYDGEGEPDAPAWDGRGALPVRRRGRTVEVATFQVGERDNALARFAGTMRKAGAGPDAIYAAMRAMLENGQIESPREDPITDKDLKRIAGSIGTRQSDAVDKERREPPAFHLAGDLLQKSLRELEYPVREIFPEGLGIVAGAPKVGKSWLTFQAAVEIACGGTLLGQQTDKPRPVLYYGLEDGERRFQKRLRAILKALHPSVLERDWADLLSGLALRYEAPAIGEGLEEDIASFIDKNGGDAVIFIDVLAKIRPASKGRGSAYDEDYGVIGPLQTLSKERPGSSLVVVTHDRKMGSDDFLTTVTGTRGVVGAADWIWVVKRPRLEDVGTIYVTGRDIERDAAITARFEGVWRLIPRLAPTSLTATAKAVWEAVEKNAPCDANQVTDEIYGDVTADPNRANHYNAVGKIIRTMEPKGYLKRVNDHPPYLYNAYTDADLASSHAGGLVVTRSSAASRAGERGPARVDEHAYDAHDALPSAESASNAFDTTRRRARAPAYTRGMDID